MDGTHDSAEPDGGPFGRPLFDSPTARALSRVGVVDVGSNSVRLVVFDGAARSPAYFYNEKIMCALGSGMSETGRLNPKGANARWPRWNGSRCWRAAWIPDRSSPWPRRRCAMRPTAPISAPRSNAGPGCAFG